MRFITEFELRAPIDPQVASTYKAKGAFDISSSISEAFDWKSIGFCEIGWGAGEKHILEIEAFPIDKWVEFKNKLFMECGMPEPNGVDILHMIKELESFGEPVTTNNG